MPRTNYPIDVYLRDLSILDESICRGVNIYSGKDTKSKLEILVSRGITHLYVSEGGLDLRNLDDKGRTNNAGRIHNAWNFYKERPKLYRDPLIRKPGENDRNYLSRLQTTNEIISRLIPGLRSRDLNFEVARLQNALNVNNEKIAELLPTEINDVVEVNTGVQNRHVNEPGVQGLLFEGLRPNSLAHAGAIKGGHYEERKYRERIGKRKLH